MKRIFTLNEPRINPFSVIVDDEWKLELSDGRTITPALAYNFSNTKNDKVMLISVQLIPQFHDLPPKIRETLCNTFGLCEENIDSYLLILSRYFFPPVDKYIPLTHIICGTRLAECFIDEDENEYIYINRNNIDETVEETADKIIEESLRNRELIEAFEKMYFYLERI